MNTKISLSKILPVLMSFFVMSFVDLVGISVDRVGSDMDLSATLAQLIPMATFLWFFLLSVPVGIIQARYGKRFVLNTGMVLTAAGLLIPFISYSFGMVLAGFALIGIGNTIVQVSANPLLLDVVPSNRASSFLSFSQFIKAVGSMIGAPLAAVFASQFGDWKLEFLVFGIISFLAVMWLGSVKIEERKEEGYRATLKTSFGLLGNSYILMMVVAIFLVVGVDVGFNSNSGQFLMKHFGIEQTAAESGRSVYFFGRMLGTFLGAIMLTKIQAPRFLTWTTALSIATVAILLVIPSRAVAWGLVFLTGLAVANIWPLIFSITVGRFPERSSEISGLMIMAVSGGAPIPFLIGWISDLSSIVLGMSVLIVCLVYILAVSVYNLRGIRR
ncbi:MAG: MFS transporter [Bacteroidales bacterium]